MRLPPKRNPRVLVASFHDRVVEGDLLDQQHIVVPIKTGARIYGSISKQFARRYPHVEIPDLEFKQAKLLTLDEEKHRTVTFVAYWDEEMRYTTDHVAICAGRAMMRFSLDSPKLATAWGLEDPWLLSMPLFKGAEKSVDYVAAIEDELAECRKALVCRGLLPCEVEIVVHDEARVPSYS